MVFRAAQTLPLMCHNYPVHAKSWQLICSAKNVATQELEQVVCTGSCCHLFGAYVDEAATTARSMSFESWHTD